MIARKGVGLALRFVIAGGILAYLFSRVPLSDVLATVSRARVEYVLAGVLGFVASMTVASRRLRVLTERQGLTISTAKLLAINLGTGFYNLFLPGGLVTAGAIRYYKMTQVEKKRPQILAAVAFDRLVATIALCFVGLLFWLIDTPRRFTAVGPATAFALFATLALYAIAVSEPAAALATSVMQRLRLAPLARRLQKFFLSVQSYRRFPRRDLALLIALSLLVHLVGSLAFFFLTRALRLDLAYTTIAWIRSATLVVTMLPISVSGLGVREGALFVLLAPYAIAGEDAIAFAFLILVVRLIVFGVLGGLVEVRSVLAR